MSEKWSRSLSVEAMWTLAWIDSKRTPGVVLVYLCVRGLCFSQLLRVLVFFINLSTILLIDARCPLCVLFFVVGGGVDVEKRRGVLRLGIAFGDVFAFVGGLRSFRR